MKAAIYVRVSTSEQAGETKSSLGHQQERCEAYAKAQGWEVAAVYEDAGASGAKADRPALNRLLADAHDGAFQVATFLKIDRFGRSQRDLHNLAFELRECGVAIASATEAIDTSTPSGQAFYGMLAVMAELERAQIAERMATGRLGAARLGRFSCGQTAYGYDYDRETKKLVINEAEAEVVRYIYGLYIKGGLSYRSLAARMNAEGLATKTGKVHSTSINGKHRGWYDSGVERLLRNPMYKGEAYYNKNRPEAEWVRIDCPAIVDEKTWDAARRRAKKNRRNSQRPGDSRNDFLLSQLIKCHCGHAMYGVTMRERYRYFYCQGQRHYGTPCHAKAINATAIEEDVLNHVIEAFRDPQRVLAACDAYGQQQREAEGWSESEMERLRGKLAAADAKRQRAIGLYTDSTISKAQLTFELKRIDKDNQMWQGELDRIQAAARQRETAVEAEQAAWAMATRVKDIVGELTVPEKKELVRASVEMVTVHSQHEIDIECILPAATVTVTAGDLPPSCYNRHVWNPGP